MTEIDARGYACPQPVIMTKNALEKKGAPVKVLVDDRTPLENITRYAKNAGFRVESRTLEDGEYEIMIE